MINQNDKQLIDRYVKMCARSRMTLEDMGRAVGRTKAWASAVVNRKTTRLQFATRNRILEYMGEL